MKCPNCGNEFEGNFCPNCGTKVENNVPQNEQQTPVQSPQNYTENIQPKKPLYKKWWFWVIIVAAILVIGGINGAINGKKSANSNKTSTVSTTTESEKAVSTTAEPTTKQETTAEPTTQKPTKSAEEKEKEYKDICDTIDYEKLARNPNNYRGDYKFTGKVIQVQESRFSNEVELRINITKKTYEYIDDVNWTDTIYATVNIPDGADKILEDDVINFWGECEGEYTYTAVMGNSITLPKVNIKYYELAD